MKQGYVLLLHENFLGDSLILLALKNEDILVGKLIATCTSDYKSSWLHLQQIRNKYYLTKIPSLFLEFSLKLKLGQYIFLATSRLCENRYSQLKLCIPNQLNYLPETYVHFVSSCKGIFCKIEPVICWKLPLDSVQSTRTVVPRAMRL